MYAIFVYEFEWSSIPGAIPLLWRGAAITLEITLMAVVFGIHLGHGAGRCPAVAGGDDLAKPAAAYVNLFRSIPFVMVILWFFLIVPQAISALFGGVTAGYPADLVAGRLLAVPGGLLFRDHSRRHPERSQGPGAGRAGAGHDQHAGSGAWWCCRRPSATWFRCC